MHRTNNNKFLIEVELTKVVFCYNTKLTDFHSCFKRNVTNSIFCSEAKLTVKTMDMTKCYFKWTEGRKILEFNANNNVPRTQSSYLRTEEIEMLDIHKSFE